MALVAVACRAETTIGLDAEDASVTAATVEPSVNAVLPGDQTESDAAGSDGAEPDAAEPDAAEPDGAERVDGEAATAFTADAPEAFDVPDEWNDEFVLDRDVVRGQLPNGTSYLIRRNERPGSQAQLRLVVQAGSLNEEPGTEGVAHFLEHMMFNGTELFPGTEIVQVLEGFGSSFGADVNAYTNYEETVYELQVPTRSSATLQLGLDVLQQWATAATLAVDDVVAERGVIREERRQRVEPLSGRIGAEVRDVLFAGSDYQGRDPIGSADVIDSMTEVEVRNFYERWYRPELMTIIAVGDFDVGDMERRIVATFVQEPPADALDIPQFEIAPGPLPEPVFDVITDREIQRTEVEVQWRLPDQPVQTPASLRSKFVATITMSMLDNRLFEQVQGGDSVLVRADAWAGSFVPFAQLPALSAVADPAQIDQALDELLVEIERARQFGFTADELDREIDAARAQIAQEFALSTTRQDNDIAQELVQFALGRGIPAEASAREVIANEVLESISVDDAQRFLFEVLSTDPYLLLTGPANDEQILPTPEQLADSYYRTIGSEVDPVERAANTISELMARPEPSSVIDQQRLDGLDATIVTYENGARLVFRQTQIAENIVRLEARSPGGFFAADGPEVPLLGRTSALVSGSGFESIDAVTLDRLLAGSLASVSSSIDRSVEGVSGDSPTNDMETMFQLVNLQMTQAIISDAEVRQFDQSWRSLAEDPSLNPQIAADLELWRLRYGDSPWFRLLPTAEDLDGLDSDLLLTAYRDRFADAGDFVFAVVGDFDESELIDLGARYLGTLPDSGRREVLVDRDPGLPEENLFAVVAAGVGDQGRVRINWESPYPFTLEADVAAQALDLVVNARLRDLLREELGASYAPNAAVSVLSEPKPWVDTIIEVESDPERVGEVSDAVHDELERIRAGALDQLYLDLAIDQLTESYRFANNNQWLELLLFHTFYQDRPSGEFRDRSAIAEQLTLADIAETASVVFPATRSVEIQLVPAR